MADTLDFHHLLAEAAERLEPLPTAAIQLAAVVARPDSGPDDVTEVLGTDPALAAHVLREANSAFSASQRAVGSLEQAVVRIGAARVLQVAVRGQLADRLAAPLELYDLDGDDRRRLSVAASSAAAVISSASPHTIGREAPCAALLHGIGMDIIDTVADPAAGAALRRAGVEQRQMEHELVAADHAEVGAFVLRRWGLPDSLVDAVEHQHEPAHSPEAAVVCLATELASQLLFGDDELGADDDPVIATASTALGLDSGHDELRNAIRATLTAEGLLGEPE